MGPEFWQLTQKNLRQARHSHPILFYKPTRKLFNERGKSSAIHISAMILHEHIPAIAKQGKLQLKVTIHRKSTLAAG